MHTRITIFTSLLLSLVLGCASVPQKDNLTVGMVKSHVIKGETMQYEVFQLFGAPNYTTKSKGGNEVWVYDKVSVDAANSNIMGTLNAEGTTVRGDTLIKGRLGLGGSRGRSSASTRTLTVIIEFDENDVVKDYSWMSTAF